MPAPPRSERATKAIRTVVTSMLKVLGEASRNPREHSSPDGAAEGLGHGLARLGLFGVHGSIVNHTEPGWYPE